MGNSNSIQIGDLSAEVMKALEDYGEHTTEEVKKAVEKVTKQTVEDIKKSSPKRTSKYAASWKSKNFPSGSMETKKTVYNAKRYQIAHLLEKGHAKRGGGRTDGKEHIAPVEEKIVNRIMDELRGKL